MYSGKGEGMLMKIHVKYCGSQKETGNCGLFQDTVHALVLTNWEKQWRILIVITGIYQFIVCFIWYCIYSKIYIYIYIKEVFHLISLSVAKLKLFWWSVNLIGVWCTEGMILTEQNQSLVGGGSFSSPLYTAQTSHGLPYIKFIKSSWNAVNINVTSFRGKLNICWFLHCHLAAHVRTYPRLIALHQFWIQFLSSFITTTTYVIIADLCLLILILT